MILYFPQKKNINWRSYILLSSDLVPHSPSRFLFLRRTPLGQDLHSRISFFFLFRFSSATAYPHKPQFECGKVRPISTTTHTRARISPLVPKREAFLVVAKITSLFLHSLLCLAAAAGALHLLVPSRKTGGIRGDHHTLIRLTILPLQEKYFRCWRVWGRGRHWLWLWRLQARFCSYSLQHWSALPPYSSSRTPTPSPTARLYSVLSPLYYSAGIFLDTGSPAQRLLVVLPLSRFLFTGNWWVVVLFRRKHSGGHPEKPNEVALRELLRVRIFTALAGNFETDTSTDDVLGTHRTWSKLINLCLHPTFSPQGSDSDFGQVDSQNPIGETRTNLYSGRMQRVNWHRIGEREFRARSGPAGLSKSSTGTDRQRVLANWDAGAPIWQDIANSGAGNRPKVEQ